MAATSLIRVSSETRDKLAKIAELQHSSIGEVVEVAVTKMERELFWKNYREAFEKLRADPVEWAAYQAELDVWDSTLMDGLEDFPYEYGPEDE